jgi:nitroreductase
MLKGSEVRQADHAVDPLFLDRWSPRAMSGEPITDEELWSLFEAARWAPSGGNSQPWRFLYARRDTDHWPTFFELLVEGNRTWATRAAVLILFVSQTAREDGKHIPSHSLDTGAAWENLALQGTRLGLVVHGMGGFDHERAREVLRVPDGYAIEMMAAVGRPGDPAQLTDSQREREKPSPRRPATESAREGTFNF